MSKRWIAVFCDGPKGQAALQFVFTSRALADDEIEASPRDYYHLDAIAAAEAGDRVLPPLVSGVDQGFPLAASLFDD